MGQRTPKIKGKPVVVGAKSKENPPEHPHFYRGTNTAWINIAKMFFEEERKKNKTISNTTRWGSAGPQIKQYLQR